MTISNCIKKFHWHSHNSELCYTMASLKHFKNTFLLSAFLNEILVVTWLDWLCLHLSICAQSGISSWKGENSVLKQCFPNPGPPAPQTVHIFLFETLDKHAHTHDSSSPCVQVYIYNLYCWGYWRTRVGKHF